MRARRLFFACVLWASVCLGAGNETFNSLPDSNNAQFRSQSRAFWQTELPTVLSRYVPKAFVYSGGLHGTAASCTSTAISVEAYTGMGKRVRVLANGTGGSAAIDYSAIGANCGNPGSDVAHVAACALTGNASGNWNRVAGTNFFVNATDSDPATPTDCSRLMQVTITNGAITAVRDKRVPGSYARFGTYDATDPLYGAVPRTLAGTVVDNTTALQAWLNAIPDYGEAFLPNGIYDTSPLTVTTPIRIRGEMGVTNVGGSMLRALADQTHVLLFKGGTGSFDPATFLVGVGLEKVVIDGGGFTISESALSLKNVGGGNGMADFNRIAIINSVGRALFLRDAQDINFYGAVITSCGSNTGQVACIQLDPTSANNVNNIKFVGTRLENNRWSFFKADTAPNDSISFMDTKIEMRNNPDGAVMGNLGFTVFDVAAVVRFSMTLTEWTGTNYFTGSTIKFTDALTPSLSQTLVQNVNGAQTGVFLEIAGATTGYSFEPPAGYNIGSISNTSTAAGRWFSVPRTTVTNGASAQFTQWALPAAVLRPDDMQFGSGGSDVISVGLAGSYSGRSLTIQASAGTAPIAAMLVPQGAQVPLRVRFRVLTSINGTPVTISYRTRTGTQVALKSAIPLSTSGWQFIEAVLSVAQLDVAEQVVLSRDSGAGIVYVDAIYRQDDITEVGKPANLATVAGGGIGEYTNAAIFMLRAEGLAGSALVMVDTNTNNVEIIHQEGTTFVANSSTPAAGKIGLDLSGADGSGRRQLVAYSNATNGDQNITWRQFAASN